MPRPTLFCRPAHESLEGAQTRAPTPNPSLAGRGVRKAERRRGMEMLRG